MQARLIHHSFVGRSYLANLFVQKYQHNSELSGGKKTMSCTYKAKNVSLMRGKKQAPFW